MNNNTHCQGGNMTNPIINFDFKEMSLTPDPRGNYVTWVNGKKQVRAALKSVGWKAVGLFRPRKADKNEFWIQARDAQGILHIVTCARTPGAVLMCQQLND